MTKTSVALSVVLLLALIALAFFWANRPRRLIIDAALPVNFPKQGFSHDGFEELLDAYVTPDGRVDYVRWREHPASVARLDSYLAAVSKFSPNTTPTRFSGRNDQLAYWMYGYNAYVIKAVLDHWPISSVTDVKAPLEVVRGLGFFYQLRFSFGGEFLSLLSVENDKVRKQFRDPRIHFILNCASASCPVVRPGLAIGDELDRALSLAASEFINDPANVTIDHDNRIIYLSKIFKWYEDDFVNDIRLDGKPVGNGLLVYITKYALDTLANDLARSSDYKIQYRDYDWHINSTG
ncbi:MAG: DUF547 domain-containing protein [Chromatiales bacterium]|jgi:hypothetical protein|nr:MAG: DUF547 domain-containing protein [Chromatiales bacterium]